MILKYPPIGERVQDLSEVRVIGNVQNNGAEKAYKKAYAPKSATMSLDAQSAAAKKMQGDAPACNVCGHITVRSGTCYKCLNCGNSLGCS